MGIFCMKGHTHERTKQQIVHYNNMHINKGTDEPASHRSFKGVVMVTQSLFTAIQKRDGAIESLYRNRRERS